MSPEGALVLGTVALVCLFFLLVGGGLVAFFVWMARRFTRTARRGNESLQVETEEYFADVAPQLQPWQTGSLADLASLIEMVGGEVLSSVHYHGLLESLDSPEATGWLAYDLRLEWGKGALQLRTSAHAIRLDITPGPIQVTVGDEPLGHFRLVRYRNATLLDASGQPIGRYQRQKRDFFWRQKGFFDPYYGPIELHGRPIAEMNNNLIRSAYINPQNRLILRLNRPVPPLFRNLAPTLTPEEETWLLALAGLQIYYRIIDLVQDAY